MNIIRDVISRRMDIGPASPDSDMKECVDFDVRNLPTCGISLRVRRERFLYEYRDITFRIPRYGDAELCKIQASWMLYMWVGEEPPKVSAWIMVDIQALLDSGVEIRDVKPVPGGNRLCAIPLESIPRNAIVDSYGLDEFLS